MGQKLYYLGVVLLAVIIWQVHAYRPCIVPPKGQMNETWWVATAVSGFHLVNHSDCDNCEKQEAWAWLRAQQGRTIPKKMCWTFHITTHYGQYVLPFNCKYYDVTKQECEMDFMKSDIKDKIKWGGQYIITHSDNKTYAAGTTCIFGKENFWWIITTDINKGLPPGVLNQVLADFTKFGFQANNIAQEGSSPLYLKRLSAQPSNCG